MLIFQRAWLQFLAFMSGSSQHHMTLVPEDLRFCLPPCSVLLHTLLKWYMNRHMHCFSNNEYAYVEKERIMSVVILCFSYESSHYYLVIISTMHPIFWKYFPSNSNVQLHIAVKDHASPMLVFPDKFRVFPGG